MTRVQIEALLQTIETGSLSKAAQAMGYTQAAISQLLNSLEAECGQKLVVREKKGSYLTAEGEMLLPFFQELHAAYGQLDRRIQEINQQNLGLVRVGTFDSVTINWLPDIIASFQARYPGIEVQIRDGDDEERQRLLQSGIIDCNFDAWVDEEYPFPHIDLHREPHFAILPMEHELKSKIWISRDDLTAYPFIRLNDRPGEPSPEIWRIFQREGIRPKVRYADSNDYAVMAMVEQNLGISVLPALSLMRSHRNILIKPLDFPSDRTIILAYKNELRRGTATATFVHYVKSWVESLG